MKKVILLLNLLLAVIAANAQPVKKMLGLGLQKKGDAIVVASKVVGTPVMEAPVYFGDTVAAVNGQPVAGLSTEQVVTLIRDAASDTITLRMKNNGAEELLTVEKITVPEIKARKAAIIRQVILKDVSMPNKIPIFTNYGFVFEMPKDDFLFADDVEFFPGGLIKRTTKRNRENSSNSNTYEETMYEILLPNLRRVNFDFNFSAFKQLGSAPDETVYYEGTKTHPKSSGSKDLFVLNNKGEELFNTTNLSGTQFNNKYISGAKYAGYHVFAVKEYKERGKYALVYKNKTPLTGFDYEEVKFWDGPGAYVRKGSKWKVVAFEEVAGAGEGPWSFKDHENGEWGFVDKNGNVLRKPKYEAASNFIEGFAAVKEDGKWGFLRPDMEWAIRPQFMDTYGVFNGGLAAVQLQNSKWIYINTAGKQAVPGEYLYAKDFQYNGSYAYVLRTDSVGAAIDNVGNTILEFTESSPYVSYAAPGLFRVRSKGVEYYKDLFEKTYLEYDFSKPRLANVDDILLAKERKLANIRHEEERQNRRNRQEQSWSTNQATTVTTATTQTQPQFKTCTKCSGTGYVTVIGSKTINGKKYTESKIHYVDEYGIASKNYFTLNCSVCKGKGTVGR